MAFTSYLNTQVLNHVFRNQPFASPTTVYVGLFTSPNTEVSGGGYVRQEITFGAPYADGNDTVIENDEEVRFPIAAADWGNITHAALFDAETGGNRLDLAEITSPRTVRENDQFVIAAGNYTVKVG